MKKEAEMLLPYAQHAINASDEEAVSAVLRDAALGAPITRGPHTQWFERDLAAFLDCSSAQVVCTSSGTTALLLAFWTLAERYSFKHFVVSDLTFTVTKRMMRAIARDANIHVLPCREGEDGLVCLEAVEKFCESSFSADALGCLVSLGGREISPTILQDMRDSGTVLVEDACHSLSPGYCSRNKMEYWSAKCFSFHPSKLITTGEGGAVVFGNAQIAERARIIRDSGLVRGQREPWAYLLVPGMNCHMSEMQAALGCSQLKRAAGFYARRKRLARVYIEAFDSLQPLIWFPVNRNNHWHLFDVSARTPLGSSIKWNALRDYGISRVVHYPINNWVIKHRTTLPLYPSLTREEQERVIVAVTRICKGRA